MTLPSWIDGALIRRLVLTYGLAVAGGGAADALDVPLAWMLGPFFICGTVAAFGVRLAIGLRFGPATLLATLSLFPVMLGASIYVIVYTLIAAALFRPMAGVNATTAIFATAAGGMADMANIAGERGGDRAAVGIVHAIRVSTTVAIGRARTGRGRAMACSQSCRGNRTQDTRFRPENLIVTVKRRLPDRAADVPPSFRFRGVLTQHCHKGRARLRMKRAGSGHVRFSGSPGSSD